MNTLVLIISSIIFVIILFFFIGLYIATTISKNTSKKHLNTILNSSPYRQDKKKPQSKPSDEFRARDERKEIVTGKAQSQEYVKNQLKDEEIFNKEGIVTKTKNRDLGLQTKDDTVIVGIAKPTGFWSRLIMSQKLGFLMNLQQQVKENKHGYFVNLIRAQARSQSKEKGRGL